MQPFLFKKLIEEDLLIPLLITIFLVFLIPVLLVSSNNKVEVSREEIIIEEKLLYSLEKNPGYSSSFILGTGSSDNKLYYYTYIKDDIGLIVKKFDAENVYILETDNIAPSYVYKKDVVTYKTKYDGFLKKITPKGVWNDQIKNENFRRVLIVPTSTIKQVYEIN